MPLLGNPKILWHGLLDRATSIQDRKAPQQGPKVDKK
jgi:hypothetical protein